MPTFSNQLPPKQAHQGFEILRTPQTSPLRGIITAADLTVCDTHFYQGRTMPCERAADPQNRTNEDAACPACQAKVPYRSHVYISAFNPKTQQHFIFECTAAAAKPLADYRDECGTLRGCLFTAERPKKTVNGKVILATMTANLKGIHLPQAPDIVKALAVIWRLPRPAIDETHDRLPCCADDRGYDRGAPTLHTAADVLKALRTPPDNAETEDQHAARLRNFDAELAAASSGNGKKRKS